MRGGQDRRQARLQPTRQVRDFCEFDARGWRRYRVCLVGPLETISCAFGIADCDLKNVVSRFATAGWWNASQRQGRLHAMFEALLAAAGLTTGLALGFAIAWAKGAPTREELAAQKARAEEQDKAAHEKL